MQNGSIRVNVTFLGLARDQVGRRAIDLELPAAATYEQLLDALAPYLDDRLGGWAWDRSGRKFTDQVRVSRSAALEAWDPESPLLDGEEVIVFPLMVGG